ncbi:MAG: SDR family NAD(P)-dependent oxidoreductase [Myxococcaceae bacterium]
MDGLRGKRALVTGGGIRLGRAIVESLLDAGADVAVHHHRSTQGAREVLEGARKQGRKAEAFQADLTQADACSDLIDRVEKQLGPLDILVNSAALFEREAFTETPLSSLDRQWALNARAPFLLSQAAARRMIPRGGGDLLNVLDIGGVKNFWRGYSAYCMSKGALSVLTQCLAVELAPLIRVNAVAPGTVLPPEGLTPEVLETLRNRIPQKRFGSPADIAHTVRFLLAGPRFMTGQVVAVDGGRSLNSAEG